MINLNLLPKNLRRRVEPGWWRLAAAGFVGITLLTMSILHISNASKLAALKNNQQQLEARVKELQPAIEQLNALNKEKEDIAKVLQVKAQLASRAIAWSDNIATLFGHLPRVKDRVEVSFGSIQGKALTPADIGANQTAEKYDKKPINIEFAVQGIAESQGAITRLIGAFENPDNDGDPANDKFGISFKSQSLDEKTGVFKFDAELGQIDPVYAKANAAAATAAAEAAPAEGGN